MDKLIKTQTKEKCLIENAFINLKKKGEQSSHGQIQARLELLEKRWKTIEKRHHEIIALLNTQDATSRAETEELSYFKVDFLLEVEELFIDEKAKFLDASRQLSSETPAAPSQSPNFGDISSISKPSRRKLPPIDVPRFSGKYSEWSSFKDFFTVLIINDVEISDVERLHYLKSNLSGEAANTIKNIPVTAENFTRAWNKLTSYYDNDRVLIYSCLNALFQLPSIPVDEMGDILVFITVQRFDSTTRRDWELSLDSDSTPVTWKQCDAFLKSRIQALERSETVNSREETTVFSRSKQKTNKTHQVKVTSHVTTRRKSSSCSYCQGDHYIAGCDKFRSISLDKRSDFISGNQFCFNCLGPHLRRECRSNRTCNTCHGRHHTLLHKSLDDTASTSHRAQQGDSFQSITSQEPRISAHTINAVAYHPRRMILATAKLCVSSEDERSSSIRALVDPCSEASFISESLAQRLKLSRRAVCVPVSGVGSTPCLTARTQATVIISPHFPSKMDWMFNALILPKLTEYLPSPQLVQADLSFIAGLCLADPSYDTTEPIEMIIGADVFTRIIDEGLRKSQDESLIAQATGIGWILTGSYNFNIESSESPRIRPPLTSLQCIVDQDLSSMLERFWKQEEVLSPVVSVLTTEEAECEQHFASTFRRNEEGRYILRLPFKGGSSSLGDSMPQAFSMLLRTEMRFNGHADFRKEYLKFMSEYEELGHMTKVPPGIINHATRSFYLPHHGIFKTSGEKRKLRVVFNGSVKLKLGDPINSCLHIGQKLQLEIFDIIIRWRMHRYVFSADIQKMFRQIQIDPEDQCFQRILWRQSDIQPAMTFNLTTVTYGLASSPFQSVRTLRQLAVDEGNRFPRAARILTENIYVDDVFAGADTLQEAGELKQELIELLKAGGFPLSKWSANHHQLLTGVQKDQLAPQNRTWQQFDEVQALGISWQQTRDVFVFRFNYSAFSGLVTKRNCLSMIAQLYDPLGWITPITIAFKLLLQTLWHTGLSWDDQLPPQLQDRWTHLLEGLKDLHNYAVPRWTGFSETAQLLELHGYSDASERAYAACVYLRSIDKFGNTEVVMLASKSKVAPVKQLSIPRLELCGALLMVRLTKRIRDTLRLEDVNCHLWSDSTITLSWIRKHPSSWKTFVANRVSQIQLDLPDACWHHVSSKNNPADLASRGVSPHDLIESSLWLHGPPDLVKRSSPWPTLDRFQTLNDCPEERTTTCFTISTPCVEFELLKRYSSLQKLLRITARWRELINYLRLRIKAKTINGSTPSPLVLIQLTPNQINDALQFWVRHVQGLFFREDLRNISDGKPVHTRSSLSRLNAFKDDQGLLRVGGRLRHALLHPDEVHPIILPRQSTLTKLLVLEAHQKTLHGGTQLTLNHLRQRFWIVRGRQLVKSVIFKCVRCWRYRAAPAAQLMGDLPLRRVRRCRPFLHSGIDFAGPIQLRLSKGRGTKSFRGYIAVFVCLATRAVHLEVASGYTTDDFLNVYRRFVARRGICASLSSDCGTNFVGADRELRALFQQAKAQSEEIARTLANDGTEWRFNPPAAPHFGGIWEAAVKSVKSHLKRIIGEILLTFEEMTTLLTQIEACLNSRPLQPLSDDPSDFDALTPGHFLIGGPTLTTPEPSSLDLNPSRLSRWQLLRQMYEHFWTRWSSEYLHELQQRPKWRNRQPPVKVGDLCIIRSNLQPPCKWPLARVTGVQPGADGLVRVVQLKTATSTLSRPIGKISILPLEETCSPRFGEGGRDVRDSTKENL